MPLPALAAVGIGAGLSALGGLFGSKGSERTLFEQMTPEMQNQFLTMLRQGGAISDSMFAELSNLPPELMLSALAQEPEMLSRAQELIESGGADPAIEAAFREAIGTSFDVAREGLGRELAFFDELSRLGAERAIQDIRGQVGASGFTGTTPGAGRIANVIAGVEAGRSDIIRGGQQQLGQLGAAQAQTMAQGLLQSRQFGLQAGLGLGQLALGRQSQLMGLRGMADTNRQLLLSNPMMNALFQASQTASQRGSGLGEAFGGLGSLFIGPGIERLVT